MKIGIITHYYKSENYGGNLQAYALCKYLEKYLAYDAEQISYKKKTCGVIKYIVWKCIWNLKNYKTISIYRRLKQRRNAIFYFNQNAIRHSDTYTDETLKNTNDIYDVFITGSDQVWHPIAVCPAYLLSFVNDDNVKLSYAASLAVDELPEHMYVQYEEALRKYKAISVRENNAVDILENIVKRNIECVLDPTLLLSREDWDEMCEEYCIGEEYVFCYFLGDDTNHRALAADYASKRGLKIVTLPNLLGVYRRCDAKFGDYRLYDISPAQFVALIKNSNYVFTDSFHASVFSIIYNINFFAFERNTKKSMGSRLVSLTRMFGLEDRFCCCEEKATIEYIESIPDIMHSKKTDKYCEAKEKSEWFLCNNLKGIYNEI